MVQARAFDVMSAPALTVTPQTTVEEAAAVVAEHGFAALWDVVVLGTFRDRVEELAATALAASVPGLRSVVVQPCATPA